MARVVPLRVVRVVDVPTVLEVPARALPATGHVVVLAYQMIDIHEPWGLAAVKIVARQHTVAAITHDNHVTKAVEVVVGDAEVSGVLELQHGADVMEPIGRVTVMKATPLLGRGFDN